MSVLFSDLLSILTLQLNHDHDLNLSYFGLQYCLKALFGSLMPELLSISNKYLFFIITL